LNTTAPLRRELPLLAGLSAGFVALLVIVLNGPPTGADRWLEGQIQSIPWGAFSFIPRLWSDVGGGVYGFYIIPALVGAVLAVKREWKLLALLGGVFVLHFVLISPKLFIVAYRPSPAFGVDGAGGLESFPSGHVEWAASFYGFVAYVSSSRFPQFRPLILAAFATIVLATMLGRIELGRHWPVDTLAGLLIGLMAVRSLVLAHHFMGAPSAPPVATAA
jgi:membrane-associated phospholipid phosphatase